MTKSKGYGYVFAIALGVWVILGASYWLLWLLGMLI